MRSVMLDAQERPGAEGQAAFLQAKTDFVGRCKQWLRRARGETVDGRDRVRALRRCKSYEWLLATHNSLQVISGRRGGYDRYQVSDKEAEESSAFDWPLLLPCPDMGSDGVCPLHFLRHRLKCNVDPFYDFSHCAWNDVRAVFARRTCGTTSFAWF